MTCFFCAVFSTSDVAYRCLHLYMYFNYFQQESQSDYAELSSLPMEIHGLTRLKVEFSCTDPDKVVGVTLSVSTPLDKVGEYNRHFYCAWRCGSHQDAGRRMRRIRLNLADDIGFRPSLFNPNATVVVAAKLFTWIIDEATWSKADMDDRRDIYKRALTRKAYIVRISPPYSRPHKRFPKSCVPWFWHYVQKNWHFTDLRTCPVEQREFDAFGHLHYNNNKFKWHIYFCCQNIILSFS